MKQILLVPASINQRKEYTKREVRLEEGTQEENLPPELDMDKLYISPLQAPVTIPLPTVLHFGEGIIHPYQKVMQYQKDTEPAADAIRRYALLY